MANEELERAFKFKEAELSKFSSLSYIELKQLEDARSGVRSFHAALFQPAYSWVCFCGIERPDPKNSLRSSSHKNPISLSAA